MFSGVSDSANRANIAFWESIGNHAEYNHSACLSSLLLRCKRVSVPQAASVTVRDKPCGDNAGCKGANRVEAQYR